MKIKCQGLRDEANSANLESSHCRKTKSGMTPSVVPCEASSSMPENTTAGVGAGGSARLANQTQERAWLGAWAVIKRKDSEILDVINYRIALKNTGATPALNVSVTPGYMFKNRNYLVDKDFSPENRDFLNPERVDKTSKYTVLPNDTSSSARNLITTCSDLNVSQKGIRVSFLQPAAAFAARLTASVAISLSREATPPSQETVGTTALWGLTAFGRLMLRNYKRTLDGAAIMS